MCRPKPKAPLWSALLTRWLASKLARQPREKFRQKLTKGELDDTDVELDLADNSSPFQGIEIPGQPGASMGMMDLGSIFGKGGGQNQKGKNES